MCLLYVTYKLLQDENQDTVSVDISEDIENESLPRTLKEATTPEELALCLQVMDDSIVGVWEYPGGEALPDGPGPADGPVPRRRSDRRATAR